MPAREGRPDVGAGPSFHKHLLHLDPTGRVGRDVLSGEGVRSMALRRFVVDVLRRSYAIEGIAAHVVRSVRA